MLQETAVTAAPNIGEMSRMWQRGIIITIPQAVIPHLSNERIRKYVFATIAQMNGIYRLLAFAAKCVLVRW